jgi:septum site-determining protein MinC
MDSPALPQRVVASTAGAPAAPRRPAAFDLKGTMAPLTVLRLKSTDLVLIERQLRVKIAQLPHLFLHAPVLLDLGALEEADPLTIPELVRVMKSCKLVPVAASNVPEAIRGPVTEAGLGILQSVLTPKGRPLDDGDEPRAAAAAEPAPEPARAAPAAVPAPAPAYGGPMVINQPVRGGQVVYAQNNDLVVLAPVNPGAQVIADGHVHIYAPLRGRAVAGAQGLSGARIFCQKLEAELVAISGAYVMAEEIPASLRGRAVQVHLENGECRLTAL